MSGYQKLPKPQSAFVPLLQHHHQQQQQQKQQAALGPFPNMTVTQQRDYVPNAPGSPPTAPPLSTYSQPIVIPATYGSGQQQQQAPPSYSQPYSQSYPQSYPQPVVMQTNYNQQQQPQQQQQQQAPTMPAQSYGNWNPEGYSMNDPHFASLIKHPFAEGSVIGSVGLASTIPLLLLTALFLGAYFGENTGQHRNGLSTAGYTFLVLGTVFYVVYLIYTIFYASARAAATVTGPHPVMDNHKKLLKRAEIGLSITLGVFVVLSISLFLSDVITHAGELSDGALTLFVFGFICYMLFVFAMILVVYGRNKALKHLDSYIYTNSQAFSK